MVKHSTFSTHLWFFLLSTLHQKLRPWRCHTTCNQRRPYFLFFGRSVSEILTPGVTAMRPFHWSRAAGTAALACSCSLSDWSRIVDFVVGPVLIGPAPAGTFPEPKRNRAALSRWKFLFPHFHWLPDPIHPNNPALLLAPEAVAGSWKNRKKQEKTGKNRKLWQSVLLL